jgi:hypothetical protein
MQEETPMKTMLCLLALAMAAAPAQAQNYPWCAVYGGRMGGAQNCGFSNYQQCMATVTGVGGFCQQNNMYRPPSGSNRRSRAYQY